MALDPLNHMLCRTLFRPAGTDGTLLERFAADEDQAAFAELVRRHGPMVLQVCRRVLGHQQDAEDAFQATFVVLARKASSLAGMTAVGGWLHGVASRTALNARRLRERRLAHASVQAGSEVAAPAADMLRQDLYAVLDEELGRLPEKYRAPMVLCYLEGKGMDEAAHQLGWPIGTVKTRLSRAREQLRGRLERRGLTLSAAALTALPARETAAALPASLAAATESAGPATASPAALTLAEEFLRGTAWKRLLAAAVLICASLAGVWGLVRAPGSDAPLHVVWRFEQGPASDLRVERGQWLHRAEGPGVMASSNAVVLLPTDLPQRPFAVTIKWRPAARNVECRVVPAWTDGSQALPRQARANLWKDRWSWSAAYISRVAFRDRWSVAYLDGKLLSIHEYDRPYPARRILLMLQNCTVEEIELKELAPGEGPAELLDVQRAMRSLVPGLTNDF